MTTKEKILFEALDQFSVRGYNAVSIRDIAQAVGVRESALYKHYKNKRDLFDSIVTTALGRIDEMYVKMNGSSALSIENIEKTICTMTIEHFTDLCIEMFWFQAKDAVIHKFRKMLTIEQYQNEELTLLFKTIFIDKPVNNQTRIFTLLMNRKVFKSSDPYILSLEFYSTFFMLQYDSGLSEDEKVEIIKKHIHNLLETYYLLGSV